MLHKCDLNADEKNKVFCIVAQQINNLGGLETLITLNKIYNKNNLVI